MALRVLDELGISTTGFRSKSWDEFALPSAPKMDFVITVCDQAAGETCPHWPGQPMTAHWGVVDPAAIEGTVETKLSVFRSVSVMLKCRIEQFLDLPLDTLDSAQLKQALSEIGEY